MAERFVVVGSNSFSGASFIDYILKKDRKLLASVDLSFVRLYI
jgi:hypothetical protein